MSKGMERLLKRMLSPNADLRCTADEAMKDIYWVQVQQKDQAGHVNEHRRLTIYISIQSLTLFLITGRSTSCTSSIVFEKDWAKLTAPEIKSKPQRPSPLGNSNSIRTPPRSREDIGKESKDKGYSHVPSPPGLDSSKNHNYRTLVKSKSQGKV